MSSTEEESSSSEEEDFSEDSDQEGVSASAGSFQAERHLWKVTKKTRLCYLLGALTASLLIILFSLIVSYLP